MKQFNYDPQKYIDELYGTNKERDSKPNHNYYLKIIGQLLIQINNLRKQLREQKL